MSEEKFLERYNNLNPEQKEAVDTIEGPILVVAGPGTGKTELLSIRVANILKKTDTLASSILCLTFTDAATSNMRERLASIIGAEAYKVNIFSFHAFGLEIMNQNPEYFFNGELLENADELTKIEIIENIIRNLDLDDPFYEKEISFGFQNKNRTCRNKIQEFKKGGISPQHLKKILENNENFFKKANPIITNFYSSFKRLSKKDIEKFNSLIIELENINEKEINEFSYKERFLDSLKLSYKNASENNSTKPLTEWKNSYLKKNADKELIIADSTRSERLISLQNIYDKYQKELRKRNLIDFDDMLFKTYEVIKKTPELKFNLQEKYQYLLVDEFQDTNIVQLGIVEEILDNPINEGKPNILAVGDDDQSIFKFQGANLDNILGFKKKLPSSKIVVLDKNYRSNKEIIELAKNTIKQGNERLENLIEEINKDISKANPNKKEREIKFKSFENNFEEYFWISQKVSSLLKEGVKENEIAIIARNHYQLEDLAKILEEKKIKINYDRKNNVLEEKIVLEIITLLKFIDSLYSKQNSKDHLLPEILSFPFWNINSTDIWKISSKAYKNRNFWLDEMLASENEEIKKIANFFIKISTLKFEGNAEEVINILIGNEIVKLDNGQEYICPLREYYFSQKELKENENKYLENLESIRAFLNNFKNHNNKKIVKLKELIEFLELNQKYNVKISKKELLNKKENSVFLLTAHKSKGLEFKHVFIIHAQDQIWLKNKRSSALKLPINLPFEADKDNHDDMLRLFFVAITRAEENLYISMHKKDSNDKENSKLRFLEKDEYQFEENKIAQENKSEIERLLEKQTLNITTEIDHEKENILKSLLENYHLSVTHLNSFLDLQYGGPEKFLEKNILHFPEMISASNAYGSAIHKALDAFQKINKASKKIPTLKNLLTLFETALQKTRISENEYEKYLKKGKKQLELFYERKAKNFIDSDLCEFDFRQQEVRIDNAKLTGKIDRLNFQDDKIHVIDYKTGKVIPSLEPSSINDKLKLLKYKNQIIFYKLLVENSINFGSKYEVDMGSLEFVDANESENIELIYPIEEREYERVQKLIPIVYNKIINLDFPSTEKYGQDYGGVLHFIEDLLNNHI